MSFGAYSFFKKDKYEIITLSVVRSKQYVYTKTSERLTADVRIAATKDLIRLKSEVEQLFKQFDTKTARNLVKEMRYRENIVKLRQILSHDKRIFKLTRKQYSKGMSFWADQAEEYPGTRWIKKLKMYIEDNIHRDRHLSRMLDGKVRTIENYFGQGKSLQTKLYGGTRIEPGLILKAYETKQLQTFFEDKKPLDRSNYVGVELEFCAPYSNVHLGKLLKAQGLDKFCKWTDDRSLRPKDGENRHELAILVKEKQATTILKKICKIVSESGAQVDDRRCGLHVHVDVRHRDKELVYNNLVACQDIFMEMTPPSRRDSEFCKRVDSKKFPKEFTGDRQERYKTVNAAAFYRHKTIEVRTHEGTVDPDEVVKWVSLLIRIANYKKKMKRSVSTVKKVVDTFKINDKIERYMLDKINYWRINNGSDRLTIPTSSGASFTSPDTSGLVASLDRILSRDSEPVYITNRIWLNETESVEETVAQEMAVGESTNV